ncbi:MAG TPA: zf-HC2 domain-containing protein [Pyrinomonadaceae bacterium]|nr:zf-HC2 domain-containing protein [Pyrinomonadaceae bacterium]
MKDKPEQTNTSCARAEDLVTYLYNEASELEAAEFRRHLDECATCAQEMSVFKSVREDVIEWRNQSLPSFDFQQAGAAPVYSKAEAASGKRSALAALRQFFTLAPAWMRAATAVAALIICALVVFTAIHFSERQGEIAKVAPQSPAQSAPDKVTQPRPQEVKQSVPQETEVKQASVVEQKRAVEVAKDTPVSPRAKSRKATGAPVSVAQQRRAAPDKAKASQEARQQLAELVQTSKDDDDLPRLSDLIEDSSGSN